MSGQPPPAVRRSEAALLHGKARRSDGYGIISLLMLHSSNFGIAENPGELCSPGQPRATVPTWFIAAYQLITAMRSCLPTLSVNRAGGGPGTEMNGSV